MRKMDMSRHMAGLNTSEVKAVELGKRFADAGAETFIFTDIATDGMLSGPNMEAVK